MTKKRSLLSKAEFDLIPCAQALTLTQIAEIKKITPKSEIEVKTDKSGFMYKSVKAAYVKKRLSIIFGWNFDFEIKSREFLKATGEVLVEGRLTIRSGNNTIIREQFGQHYTSTQTDANDGGGTTTHPSDIGNAYKAAATDALKKCASEIGICWDVYGQEHSDKKKEEQPEPDHAEKKILERLEHFLAPCNTSAALDEVYGNFSDNHTETEATKKCLTKHIERVNRITG